MSLVTITIPNWQKYNPRKDLKTMPWFRVESHIATDPKLFGLTPEEKWLWIVLLSLASIEMKDTVVAQCGYISMVSGIKECHILKQLATLEQNQLVTVHDRIRSDSSVPTNGFVPNRTEQNEQNRTERDEQNNRLSAEAIEPRELFDFWNSHCGDLPKARALTDARRRKIISQIRKYPEWDHWRDALQKLSASEFATQKWRPTLDDYLDEKKRTRALEGSYDNRADTRKTLAQTKSDGNAKLVAMAREGFFDEE